MKGYFGNSLLKINESLCGLHLSILALFSGWKFTFAYKKLRHTQACSNMKQKKNEIESLRDTVIR